MEGIKSHLLRDDYSSFYCHNPTGGEEDEDGEGDNPSGREAHCAGAVAFLLSRGRSNIAMHLAFAEGLITSADFAPAINVIATDD